MAIGFAFAVHKISLLKEAEQLKRTGKTVQEEIAAIKTDITTGLALSQSGKLESF